MPLTDGQIVLRLLLAAGIGAVLGVERELRRKSAGFRTNILIGLGACLFTIVGTSFGAGDPFGIAISDHGAGGSGHQKQNQ